jgi:hypothetical protein
MVRSFLQGIRLTAGAGGPNHRRSGPSILPARITLRNWRVWHPGLFDRSGGGPVGGASRAVCASEQNNCWLRTGRASVQNQVRLTEVESACRLC